MRRSVTLTATIVMPCCGEIIKRQRPFIGNRADEQAARNALKAQMIQAVNDHKPCQKGSFLPPLDVPPPALEADRGD